MYDFSFGSVFPKMDSVYIKTESISTFISAALLNKNEESTFFKRETSIIRKLYESKLAATSSFENL